MIKAANNFVYSFCVCVDERFYFFWLKPRVGFAELHGVPLTEKLPDCFLRGRTVLHFLQSPQHWDYGFL